MAMRLLGDHSVGLATTAASGVAAASLAAIQWFGEGGAIAALGGLIGVVVAAFLAVVRSLFTQVRELRADNERLRSELDHEREVRRRLEDRVDELTARLLQVER